MNSHITFSGINGEVTLPVSAVRLYSDCTGNFIGDGDDRTWGVTKQEYNRLRALLTSPEPEQEQDRVCNIRNYRASDSIVETFCEGEWLPRSVDPKHFRFCPCCGGKLVLKGGEE